MAERTRTSTAPDLINYSESDLESALNDFLREQQPPQKINLFNFATISGLGILFVTTLFMIQQIVPWFGPSIDSNFIQVLPLLGGILVTLTGLGFFVGNRKEKKVARAKMAAASQRPISLDELNEKSKLDPYALSRTKRLYKSRSERRIFGVCGGLAKYLGLNPFAVRILWAIATLSFAPVMLPLYFIMAVIMPKEPQMFQPTRKL